MKNILIIHHGRGVGGGLIALLGLIEELKQKNNVHVLCVFDSEAVQYIQKLGVEVIIAKSKFYSNFYGIFVHSEASYFDIIDLCRNLKNLISFFLNKYIFAKKELSSLNINFDIIYLNSTFISDWALAAKKYKKQTFIHIREPLAKGVLGIRRSIIKNDIDKYCDKIIAISKDNALRVGLETKTTIVYDPVVVKGRSFSNAINQNPNFKHFLYMGGMQRIKGFEQLVQALPYLNENVRIYFLGGDFRFPDNKFKRFVLFFDPYMWRINSLIKSLNKSKHIIKIGLVDNIFDYYANSLSLVSPFSKPHAALPVLESFSVGKPVIVSDIIGMDELVDLNNGLFFRNGNGKELASAINKMSTLNNSEYFNMCDNAKNKFVEIVKHNQSVQSIIDNHFLSI
ncbi:glycosyltransferase [Flavobacterium sp. 3-218]